MDETRKAHRDVLTQCNSTNNRYPIPTGGDLLNFISMAFDQKRQVPNFKASELKVSKSELLAIYEDWNPIVQRLIGLIDEPESFPLFDWLPIENWVFEDGRVVLIGDAAHVRPHEVVPDNRQCFLIMDKGHRNPLKTPIVSLVV